MSSFIILTTLLVGSLVARAQAPWSVTLVPTRNPLPIGGCAAVRLQLMDPNSMDTPRNPKGAYVSLADFDFTVTAADPRSVAGQYDGASYFSACACQGAAVGTIATVTATYPATTLAQKARVPGVAFQASATFALAKANGASDPPACAVPHAGVAVSAASQTIVTISAQPGGAAGAAAAGGGGGTSASGGGAAAGAGAGATKTSPPRRTVPIPPTTSRTIDPTVDGLSTLAGHAIGIP